MTGSESWSHLERVLEAVGGGFLVALCCLVALLAKEEHLVVQEDVPLHGLEARQVLHLVVPFFMVCPHVEGALHKQFPKVTEVPLNSGS